MSFSMVKRNMKDKYRLWCVHLGLIILNNFNLIIIMIITCTAAFRQSGSAEI